MPDNPDRYVPEFDEEDMRGRVSTRSREDLIDMLIRSYKQTRIMAKMSDELSSKLTRIESIIDEPSALSRMPGIPGPDELRRMTE